MRARTAVISLVCAAALVVAGCSSQVTGSPQMLGADGTPAVVTPSASAPAGPSAPRTDSPPTPRDSSPDTQPDSSPESSAAGGDGGDTGLPDPSGGSPGLPTDPVPRGAPPSGLGSIPPELGNCLKVAGLEVSISVLFLGPGAGQPVTEDQVDAAFAQMGQVPSAVRQPIEVLHEAALQAVGRSPADAERIVTSDKVNQAMDALSNYTDSTCGG